MPYKEHISGVYMIANRNTGMQYIGSSNHVLYRWIKHKQSLRKGSHRNRLMQADCDKHGVDSFEMTVLETADPADLFGIEQKYLDDRLASGHCYNIYSRADNTNTRGTETLQRMSEGKIGRPMDDATKKKISATLAGNPAVGHPGSLHPYAILSETDIPTIRRLLKTKLSCAKIGALYGVSRHTIWAIKKGKSWRHVPHD